VDKISFYPYFYVKDLVGWVGFAFFSPCLYIFIQTFWVTRITIFLRIQCLLRLTLFLNGIFFWVYAILRSIPNKFGGLRPLLLCSLAFLLSLSFTPHQYEVLHSGPFIENFFGCW
jgi:ubiquinol-cytochrome c reductase cytochrome b subunit